MSEKTILLSQLKEIFKNNVFLKYPGDLSILLYNSYPNDALTTVMNSDLRSFKSITNITIPQELVDTASTELIGKHYKTIQSTFYLFWLYGFYKVASAYVSQNNINISDWNPTITLESYMPIPYYVSLATYLNVTPLLLDMVTSAVSSGDVVAIKTLDKDATFNAVNGVNITLDAGLQTPEPETIVSSVADYSALSDDFTYPAEAYHPSAISIGDTRFWYLPVMIAVREFNSIMPLPIASVKGDAVATSGQRSQQIEMVFTFNNSEYNEKLRRLLAQFIKHPITTMESSFLQNIFYPGSLPLRSVPDFIVYNKDYDDATTFSEEDETILAYMAYQDVEVAKLEAYLDTDTRITTPWTNLNDDAKLQLLPTNTVAEYNSWKRSMTNYEEIKEYIEEYSQLEYTRHGISEKDSQIPIALKHFQINSVPGYPNMYNVSITAERSNLGIYGGYFEYIKTKEDVPKTVIHHIARSEPLLDILPVQTTFDPGKSEPYQIYYETYMNKYLQPISIDDWKNNGSNNVGQSDFIISYSYTDDVALDVLLQQIDTHQSRMDMARKIISNLPSAKVYDQYTLEWLKDIKDYIIDSVYFAKVFITTVNNIPGTVSKYMRIAANDDIQFDVRNLYPNPDKALGDINNINPNVIKEYKEKSLNLFGENGDNFSKEALTEAFKTGYLTAGQMAILITEGNMPATHLADMVTAFSKLLINIKKESIVNYKERYIKFSNNQMHVGIIEYEMTNGVASPVYSDPEQSYTATIVSFSAGLGNKISPMPILGFNVPTHQYMGRNSWNGTFNIQTDDPRVKKEIALMQERCRQLITYKQMLSLKPEEKLRHITLSTQGGLFGMLGINNIVISDTDYRTVEQQPGFYNVTMNFIETSINRKHPEVESIQDGTENYVTAAVATKMFQLMTLLVSDVTGKGLSFMNSMKLLNGTSTNELIDMDLELYTTFLSAFYKAGDGTLSVDLANEQIRQAILSYVVALENATTTDNGRLSYTASKSFGAAFDPQYNYIVGNDDYTVSIDRNYVEPVLTPIGNMNEEQTQVLRYFTDKLKEYQLWADKHYGIPALNMFSNVISENQKVEYFTKEILGNENDLFSQNGSIFTLLYKFNQAAIYGVLDIYTDSDILVNTLELAADALEDLQTNIFSLSGAITSYIMMKLTGGEIGYAKKLKDKLGKLLRFIELVQMIKIVLNTPKLWLRLREEIYQLYKLYPMKSDTIDELIGLIDTLEKRNHDRTNKLHTMFADDEIPIEIIQQFEPKYYALYHPTFYLYSDPREVLRNEITEMQQVMSKQANVMDSFITDMVDSKMRQVVEELEKATVKNNKPVQTTEFAKLVEAVNNSNSVNGDDLLNRLYNNMK